MGMPMRSVSVFCNCVYGCVVPFVRHKARPGVDGLFTTWSARYMLRVSKGISYCLYTASCAVTDSVRTRDDPLARARKRLSYVQISRMQSVVLPDSLGICVSLAGRGTNARVGKPGHA